MNKRPSAQNESKCPVAKPSGQCLMWRHKERSSELHQTLATWLCEAKEMHWKPKRQPLQPTAAKPTSPHTAHP